MTDVRYLIFDVEAVGDGDLIQRVRYPEDELDPQQAVQKHREDLLN